MLASRVRLCWSSGLEGGIWESVFGSATVGRREFKSIPHRKLRLHFVSAYTDELGIGMAFFHVLEFPEQFFSVSPLGKLDFADECFCVLLLWLNAMQCFDCRAPLLGDF